MGGQVSEYVRHRENHGPNLVESFLKRKAIVVLDSFEDEDVKYKIELFLRDNKIVDAIVGNFWWLGHRGGWNCRVDLEKME